MKQIVVRIAVSVVTQWFPFSKVPRLFGPFRVTVLFVSPKRLEARNFAPILIVIALTIYEKTSFTE